MARSNQETDDGKNASPCLTQKAPYKGLGAESEEKREPVSDIDTAVVDSLKALDPDGRLEKRTNSGECRYVRLVPILLQKSPMRAASCAGVQLEPWPTTRSVGSDGLKRLRWRRQRGCNAT